MRLIIGLITSNNQGEQPVWNTTLMFRYIIKVNVALVKRSWHNYLKKLLLTYKGVNNTVSLWVLSHLIRVNDKSMIVCTHVSIDPLLLWVPPSK